MTIEIEELIEAVKESMYYPYGGQPYIDARDFLDALYSLKARKETVVDK
jgi:hypothetical protein